MTHYLDYEGTGDSIDLGEYMTRVCVCGSEWFKTVIQIDEDYEIAAYGLDGECIECGSRVKLPCPSDR